MAERNREIEVKGKIVDGNTRCIHYHSPLDVIAIKFKCCGEYYPCYECHVVTADHTPQVWAKEEWDIRAILCGVCKNEMTIRQYMDSANRCPHCQANFNPGCNKHYHLYFQT